MVRPNILDRFRPVGAPGPAGPVGVPAADDQGPSAELLPVFAALAADVSAGSKVVEQAQQEAEALVARARERAEALVTRARLDAGAERLRAAARIEESASVRDLQLLERARAQAAELTAAGATQIPALAQTLLEGLFDDEPLRQP